MALNIYAWITLPRCFINSMATTTVTRLSKKVVAYLAQIAEASVSGILVHSRKYVIYSSHINDSIIIDIIVKSRFWGEMEIFILLRTQHADQRRLKAVRWISWLGSRKLLSVTPLV